MNPASLYIHIPFCRNKCIYCDFYSGGVRLANWKQWADALISELSSRKYELINRKIISIYFGGGTPSLIPEETFEILLNCIYDVINRENIVSDCEISIEANPEDISESKVIAWKNSGVNRVSIGIQTFSDNLLKIIGRKHSGEKAFKAVQYLKSVYKNVSADLMFGLPGQSIDDVKDDLNKLIELNPQHISVYSLMYEQGTALTQLSRNGLIDMVSEEISEEMYLIISNQLKKAGYERYETSNYAKPGFESRHNFGYWTGRQYVGIGPSAHSFDGVSKRFANPADLKLYIAHFNPDKNSAEEKRTFKTETEHLSLKQRIEERIMLSLRMKKGISLNLFVEEFGSEELQYLMKRAQKSISSGKLIFNPIERTLQIPDEHILISDSIIVELIP